ncbi:hypothetical protein [Actomonas aquatica]|uniref:Tetratricopeptide repeat protein n=1 Tax=Actomonas aquatica TaxID=2866162 RepID=A0ABZ1C6Y2_9BACT|nr:hypothetical protein [Opitutus sp. WL0086]WRQ87168.1 hypothetical protein K1X11_020340 [Opitutus sp. WL0086]
MGWLTLGLIGGYLSVGIALYCNDFYRRGLQEISLWDRLYPPNWPAYSRSRGESMIHLAEAALEEGNLPQAFHLLRSGLARSPQNLTGRRLLTDIYLYLGRKDLAVANALTPLREIPVTDLDWAYCEESIRFLFREQRDETIVSLTTDLLQSAELPVSAAQFLALAQSNALLFRGNFDQAEDTLRRFDLELTPEGRVLSAKIEWERGFQELAVVLIDQLAHEFPTHQEIYSLQNAWLRDSGAPDRARHLSLLRRIDYPDELQPRIDLLTALDATDDDDAVRAETELMLRQFAANPQAALMLGDFAANSGRPEIADHVFAHAAAHQHSTSALALMRVESLIVAQRHAEAVQLTRELLQAHPEWEDQFAPIFNGLLAIANYALGDREAANLYLTDFLNLKNVRAENLVAVAQRLRNVGADQQAVRVLQQAVATDPLNQLALTALIEFELQRPTESDLTAHLSQLLTMRRPSPQLLRQAYQTLGRDRFAFVPGREEVLDRISNELARSRYQRAQSS